MSFIDESQTSIVFSIFVEDLALSKILLDQVQGEIKDAFQIRESIFFHKKSNTT